MNFLLQAGFPIGLLIVPMFLVGQPRAIIAIGFIFGIAMSILALGSTGFRASLSGAGKGARVHLLVALGVAALAVVTTIFVNENAADLASRPIVHAQVSMMPPVIWGGAAGFLLAAALTWLRKESA